jgi:hypothetical protein
MITKRSFAAIAVGTRAAGLLLTLAGLPVAASADSTIKARDLKALFSGADVHLDMTRRPSHGWVNALWKFSGNGSLSGYLFTSAYTARQQPENLLDTGEWRVKENRLCVRWLNWDNGEERCYRIARQNGSYSALGESGLFTGRFTLVLHKPPRR